MREQRVESRHVRLGAGRQAETLREEDGAASGCGHSESEGAAGRRGGQAPRARSDRRISSWVGKRSSSHLEKTVAPSALTSKIPRSPLISVDSMPSSFLIVAARLVA